MNSSPVALPLTIPFGAACDALGVPKRTAELLLKREAFPRPFLIGRRRFYRLADLTAWVDSKAAASSDQTP